MKQNESIEETCKNVKYKKWKRVRKQSRKKGEIHGRNINRVSIEERIKAREILFKISLVRDSSCQDLFRPNPSLAR